jgi:hypothetical protein
MNPDRNRLLDEILKEAAPAEFRNVVLEQTLRRVRRRRVVRQVQRGVVAMALLAALPFVIWRTFFFPIRETHSPIPKFAAASFRSLAPCVLVETKPGGVETVASSVGAVVIVETATIKDAPKEITDEELLALTAGRPAVLVRQSPHQAELLFVNAEDQNGFPVQ